jgi:single-stranded DNA-specific DHH superfamily exonuclease
MVYGDYDVDGTTGTTMLFMTLKKLGGYVIIIFPTGFWRLWAEFKSLELFARDGVNFYTVDCGTTM